MDIIEEIGRHYWAMRPRNELGPAVREVFRRYQRELSGLGWSTRIGDSCSRYYGYDTDGGPATSSDVLPGGEQGEIELVQVNHYRSLIRSMLGLATSSRPAFSASAASDSAESAAACQLAEQLWEHELERGLEIVAREGAEHMLVEAEVGVLVTWDPTAGDVVGSEPIYDTGEDGQPVTGPDGMPVQTGERPIYSGDLVYEAIGPRDLARDTKVRDRRATKWVIAQRVLPRWDLAATYADDESFRAIQSADGPRSSGGFDAGESKDARAGDGEDQCYVLELYHADSPAMPGGRFARIVGEYVLEEGPLPYTRLPVVIKSPAGVFGHALGYSDAWDLLGLAKLLDSVVSDMASTASRHGQRPVLMPDGCDVSPSSLTGPGVVSVKVDPATGRMVVPEWMDVPEIPATQIAWADWLQGQMQTLSGINSVVRGDPEASLKSGAALALVQAMAVQHNSAFQAAYAELLRDLATLVIDLYRENARAERLIDIVGDDEVGTVRSFTGDDLEGVRRIRAELANPLMRTIAGKKELADFYADPQRWPTDPPLTRTQHIGFITSGRLDSMFRADRSEAIGIKAEGEALARGKMVPVLVSDSHEKHVREHKALIDGKQRMQLSPEVIEAISTHIIEHLTQWVTLTTTNPALLAATGQRPAPMAAPPMVGPDGMPMGPGGPPMPANDNGQPPMPMGAAPANDNGGPPMAAPQPGAMGEPPVESGARAARMPNAPINPATGERARLPDGALG